jgi:predicted lipoprotein
MQMASCEGEMRRRPSPPAADFDAGQSAERKRQIVKQHGFVTGEKSNTRNALIDIPIMGDTRAQIGPGTSFWIADYLVRKSVVEHYDGKIW